jgi:hypothetical protein
MTVNPTELWLPSSVEFTDEELQERQREKDMYYQLAEKVRDYYKENPDHLLEHVVNALDSNVTDVTFVLNEFRVQDNGSVEHMGQGMGGGWVPPATISAGEPEQLGYRWPDGELRDEPFNIENEQHRESMGINLG